MKAIWSGGTFRNYIGRIVKGCIMEQRLSKERTKVKRYNKGGRMEQK